VIKEDYHHIYKKESKNNNSSKCNNNNQSKLNKIRNIHKLTHKLIINNSLIKSNKTKIKLKLINFNNQKTFKPTTK
jgi:hypothetical protein